MNEATLKQIRQGLLANGFEEAHVDRFRRLYRALEMHEYGKGRFDLLDLVVKQPQLLFQKPETLNGNVENSAELLDITKQALVAAALKQPSLFRQKPETLDSNAARSASLLGIAKQAFVGAALKQPQLLFQKPETLSRNAENSAGLLDITKQAFVAAALKQPQLLYQKPETLNGNVANSARLLDVTKQALVAAALKQPSLFCQKPETLDSNAARSARLLGIAKQAFVAAALKQPQLLYQKPDTVDGNAARCANLIGVTKQAFVAAVLKNPTLLCLKPGTLFLKKSYILKIKEALDETTGFGSFIVNAPVALACGTAHLHACYILAKLGLKTGSLGSLVTLPAREAERMLLCHFAERIGRSGRGERTLQIMHAMNIIKNLPAGISEISRPHRIRNPPSLQSRVQPR